MAGTQSLPPLEDLPYHLQVYAYIESDMGLADDDSDYTDVSDSHSYEFQVQPGLGPLLGRKRGRDRNISAKFRFQDQLMPIPNPRVVYINGRRVNRVLKEEYHWPRRAIGPHAEARRPWYWRETLLRIRAVGLQTESASLSPWEDAPMSYEINNLSPLTTTETCREVISQLALNPVHAGVAGFDSQGSVQATVLNQGKKLSSSRLAMKLRQRRNLRLLRKNIALCMGHKYCPVTPNIHHALLYTYSHCWHLDQAWRVGNKQSALESTAQIHRYVTVIVEHVRTCSYTMQKNARMHKVRWEEGWRLANYVDKVRVRAIKWMTLKDTLGGCIKRLVLTWIFGKVKARGYEDYMPYGNPSLPRWKCVKDE